jgi:O-antigen ligase
MRAAASASLRGRALLERVPYVSGASVGAWLLTLGLPALFLHVEYQPGLTVGLGSTSVGVELADVAVLAIVVATAVALLTGRGELPRAGLPVWIPAALLLVLIAAATVFPLAREADYAFADHAVTAVKFAEYALLAAAVPVLIRRTADVRLLLVGVAAWAAFATTVGVLQFLGLVDEFEGRRPGQREPSLLGIHDFAALSAAALALALVAVALGAERPGARRIAIVAGIAGAVGVVLSGALAGVVAVVLSAAACAVAGSVRRLLTARRVLALAAIAAAVAMGVLAMRSADLDELLDVIGVARAEESGNVESYAHREVLLYIGLRIFLGHPVLGAGWQASFEEDVYGPYLDDARRRYPDEPSLVFPSPAHPWGVQNAYVQALADLGLVGLALLAALVAAGFVLAGRVALRGPPVVAGIGLVALCWLLVVLGVWTGVGLIPGLPVTALFWLALGLAVASARGFT